MLERKAIAASLQLREGKKPPQEPTRMTALVKGSVSRGHAPLRPEAHMIKYARGGAIELMVKVSLVISPSYDRFLK